MRLFFVELGNGFQHSFMTRQSEWLLAFVMTMGGWIFLLPFNAYDQTPYWIEFRHWITEDSLGSIFLIIGLARLLVLALNGSFRPLYHLRAWLSVFGMMVWLTMSMGFIGTAPLGLWAAIFPVFTVTEIVNALRAAGDAGRNDRRVACEKAKRAAVRAAQGLAGHAG